MDTFGLEPGLGRQLAEDQKCTGPREAAAFRVEEEFRAVTHVQEWAPTTQVTPQCLRGLPADRDDALLRAFADAAHESRLQIDTRLLQADRLADPQSGAVQKLDERAVAKGA